MYKVEMQTMSGWQVCGESCLYEHEAKAILTEIKSLGYVVRVVSFLSGKVVQI